MNILIATNDAYAFPTLVLLKSLQASHKNIYVNVYLMYHQLTEENQRLLRKAEAPYLKLFYIYVSLDIFEGVPLQAEVNTYITVETYFRLAVVELLPPSVDRILYLDTDIIVNHSILDLYESPMGETVALIACEDFGIKMVSDLRRKVFANLKLEDTYKYFNAGVILFNMEYLRRYCNFNRFKEFIVSHHEQLVFHDQDVLNAMFSNNVKYADYKIYNCRPFFFAYTKKNCNWICRNAAIIHYGEKPWQETFTDMCGDLFWKYAADVLSEKQCAEYILKNRIYIKKHFGRVFVKRLKRNIKFKLVYEGKD